MKLEITTEAAGWFKKELNLQNGDFLRFFVKLYGGIASVHPNYSLGIIKETPQNMTIHTIQEGITFYFNEQDDWYLQDFNLKIGMKNGEAHFDFQPILEIMKKA